MPGYSISVSDLIDHYIESELSAAAVWHSHATRTVHQYFFNKWMRRYWGTLDILQSFARVTCREPRATFRRLRGGVRIPTPHPLVPK
jgi:hypothetical protein